MNIDYLKNVLIPKRKKEIKEGKNLMTHQPIYIVLDLRTFGCHGDDEYIGSSSNLKGKEPIYGWIDRSDDDPDLKPHKNGMDDPEYVKEFYIDKFVAFFFTSESAHDYLKYQAHNLSDGYVYVFSSGYSNREMDELLAGK